MDIWLDIFRFFSLEQLSEIEKKLQQVMHEHFDRIIESRSYLPVPEDILKQYQSSAPGAIMAYRRLTGYDVVLCKKILEGSSEA